MLCINNDLLQVMLPLGNFGAIQMLLLAAHL